MNKPMMKKGGRNMVARGPLSIFVHCFLFFTFLAAFLFPFFLSFSLSLVSYLEPLWRRGPFKPSAPPLILRLSPLPNAPVLTTWCLFSVRLDGKSVPPPFVTSFPTDRSAASCSCFAVLFMFAAACICCFLFSFLSSPNPHIFFSSSHTHTQMHKQINEGDQKAHTSVSILCISTSFFILFLYLRRPPNIDRRTHIHTHSPTRTR
ncbi:unnamed protein product [Trypanosoma congolense IL3000]|uniref:WGS project CAEQ00000000 data, annotated contig 257 n=1 Tax=Trypanosoma congolense (strain IL3000) TaxID=1068625 RepID=F9WEE7_TRYCI|nr:unnamed protein product [Trypanosoma congolense IL3000]